MRAGIPTPITAWVNALVGWPMGLSTYRIPVARNGVWRLQAPSVAWSTAYAPRGGEVGR